MNEMKARSLVPAWATAEIPAGNSAPKFRRKVMNRMSRRTEKFIRDHMLTVLLIVVVCLEGMIVSAGTAHRVRKETEDRLAAEYAAQLEAYKAEQARQIQAESFLSGSASLEVAINREVDAVVPVIARLKTDTQKQTETGIMLARVMNSGFPNSFQEVAEQKNQWPLYDGTDRTYTQHDRDLAEGIIRPYMESGIIPLDLTKDFCWGTWSENDFVARDSYTASVTINTWKYHG